MDIDIIHPERYEPKVTKYRATDEDGMVVVRDVNMYNAVHVCSERYEPFTKDLSKRAIELIEYARIRNKMGMVAARHYLTKGQVASYILLCVCRVYWNTVFKHVIKDHDVVSCCGNMFTLKVSKVKYIDPALITPKNGGMVHIVALSLTAKGYKRTKGIPYVMYTSRKSFNLINEEIANGRYYG